MQTNSNYHPEVPVRIAIFASGSGTNAENIIRHFNNSIHARVVVVLTNNEKAGVIQRAKKFNVPVIVFNRTDWQQEKLMDELTFYKIDVIVLAGFLWLIPASLVAAFPFRIVNIHPALLPGFGGKGMYGNHVHTKVIESGCAESGITIHYVNEHYDDGDIIFQASCPVLPNDTPETLAARIHSLEYHHYPLVIEKMVTTARSGMNP